MSRNLFNAQMAQYATPTTTGESSVVIENGVKCYLPELKVAGNTFQQTYTGKNLAYASDSNRRAAQYTKTEYINKNNFIISTTNKTSTHSKGAVYDIPIKPNTTYTISLSVKRLGVFSGTTQIQTQLDETYVSGTSVTVETENANYLKTVNSGSATKISVNFIVIANDAVGEENNPELVIENFMIVEGSTKIEYEPYVGGIPAPSPDYPQDIINAGDNKIEIAVRGNNLFDVNNIKLMALNQATLDSYSPKVEDGVFYSGGIVGKSSGAVAYIPNPYTSTGTKYLTFTAEWDDTETKCYVGLSRINNVGEDGIGTSSLAKQLQLTTNGGTYTISAGVPKSHFPYIGLVAYSTTKYGLRLTNIQISTEDIPYEPYIEPQTITIPLSVEVEGKTVDLRFAKVGDIADRLIVDGLNKKVIYQQKTHILTLTGEEVGWYAWNTSDIGQPIACSGAKLTTTEFLPLNKGKGMAGIYCNYLSETKASTEDTKVLGICYYNMMSVNNYWWAINLGQPDLDTTKSKLQEFARNGNPLYVVYPLNTSIPHDITDSSIAEQLLGLIQNNGTTIIEASNPNNLSQILTAKYLKHS